MYYSTFIYSNNFLIFVSKLFYLINIFSDGGLLDQRHLQFLAEISSRNLSININEPSVTESSSEGKLIFIIDFSQ